MDNKQQIKEISEDIMLTALHLSDNNLKQKLVKVAQEIFPLEENPDYQGAPLTYPSLKDFPLPRNYQGEEIGEDTLEEEPSKFGIDRKPEQPNFKVTVEFLYIPADNNEEARKKIIDALGGIPDELRDKVNVGEAQAMSVKKPK